MLKVQEELRWGNGFTYKFEFYSVSMKLIFGRVTNVLLMLNNNFTHQISLLTPVFITHFVFCVAQLLHSTPLQRGARHAVRENAVVRWPHGSIRFQSYICQPLSMFSRCWDCYLFSFLSVKFRVIKIGWVIEDVWREVISVYFCSWINLLSSTCRDLLLSNWAFVILISRLFWRFPKKLSPYWKHHSKSDSD